MNQEQAREPRILLIKGDSPEGLARIWKDEFPCETIDFNLNSSYANRERNPKNYDVLIIDAGDNYQVEGTSEDYTEHVRKINPNLFIIGMSAMGYHFTRDDLSKKLYDARLPIAFPILPSEIKRIKEVIEKRGFSFRSK
ncbi:DEAD/DEAH box helicase family protein [Candidatus Pacearchaeota archaeon]|nr:DEAD/DEAH box helicase family protein [Candidatus Pacearchaeota archaeon]